MLKKILGLILFISPLFLLAHDPLSAVYRLKNNSDRSVLTINLTQSGINKTLRDIHGTEFLNTITEKNFKKVIVDYVKSNFKLKINDSEIQLKSGGIRLGNHQTDLTFITSYIPEYIDKIDIEITSFKNNRNHSSIFYFSRGSEREKVILSSKNNFKSEIDFTKLVTIDSEETNIESYSSKSSNTTLIIISLLLISLLIFTGPKLKKII